MFSTTGLWFGLFRPAHWNTSLLPMHLFSSFQNFVAVSLVFFFPPHMHGFFFNPFIFFLTGYTGKVFASVFGLISWPRGHFSFSRNSFLPWCHHDLCCSSTSHELPGLTFRPERPSSLCWWAVPCCRCHMGLFLASQLWVPWPGLHNFRTVLTVQIFSALKSQLGMNSSSDS